MKIKIDKILTNISAILLVLLSISSCEDEFLKKKTETVRVTFETFGGSEIPFQEVFVGTPIRKPSIPKKSMSFFAGWFQDEELTRSFSYGMLIQQDLTLYAKWRPGVVINYESNGGNIIANDTVPVDDYIQPPLDPFLDGSVFVSWCTDPDLKNEFDFAKSRVNQNITLYAKWIRGISVIFQTDSRVVVPSIGLLPGGLIIRPELDPVVADSTFMGWFTDRSYTEEYDFSKPVLENTVIYAKWLPNKFVTTMLGGGTFIYIWGFKPEYANETTVYVPGNIGGIRIARIEDNAFKNNTNITELYVGDCVGNVGTFAIRSNSFSGCSNLRKVRFPNNFGGLAANSFENCTSLGPVLDISNYTKAISYWSACFKGCTSLEEVRYPKNCTSINPSFFENCSNLKKFYIEGYIKNDATGVKSPITMTDANALAGCHPNLLIYVPTDLVDKYKVAANWSNYADKFRALP